ncbi:hypothetical protein [Nostoc sp. WHI]|uniref:hypothetical protein n=1 Tax=Nostoc sp. WHI TaxID=2650611 RepID=UPI0018C5880E|nr:hypothetical protein [Nostoc sp. WHI]
MNNNGLIGFFAHLAEQSSLFEKSEIRELSAAIANLAEMEGTSKKEETNDFDINSKYKEVQDKLIIVLKEQNAINLNKKFSINTLFREVLKLIKSRSKPSVEFASASPGFRKFNSSLTDDECELEIISKESFSLTKTYKIKICQKYKGIPVYGSRITLEMNESNKLLAINSLTAIADPKVLENPQKAGNIHVENIKSQIKKETRQDLEKIDLNLHLYYYYDKMKKTWRLVYITDIKYKNNELNKNDENGFLSEVMDYIIDASNGSIIDNIPCIKTIHKDNRLNKI